MNTNRLFLIIGASALLGCSVSNPINIGTGFRLSVDWFTNDIPHVELDTFPRITQSLESKTPLSALYGHNGTHQMVVDFVLDIAGSEEIAMPILYYADRYDVPLSLALSVAWVESRFQPDAQYTNASSVDRGLFQLNSKSFLKLEEEDFFHPDTNALHAAEHLQYCLRNSNGEYRTALAIYNAGLGRVIRGTIPQSTQIYVGRVMDYRHRLVERFHSYILDQLSSDKITHVSVAW